MFFYFGSYKLVMVNIHWPFYKIKIKTIDKFNKILTKIIFNAKQVTV